MLHNFFGNLKSNRTIGIDLGTANTLVYTQDKGIVIDEPSVVAINIKTDQILAVGNEAKHMLGKTPPHIQVTRPLQHGIISDFEVTEKMLKFFIDKVTSESFSLNSRPRMIIGVPLDVTEVEIKAVEDASLAAGAREVVIVQEPMLAAIGARMPIENPVGSLIVDIGGGNTEVAVISLSGVVTWKSTPIAGDELNKNIIQYARDVFNLLVGETQAEHIKIAAATALELDSVTEHTMRGRDVVSGLPREVVFSENDVFRAIQRSVHTIVDHIKMTLESTPPELTADIHERGMLLAGGGALLRGLDTVISDITHIPVRIVDDPRTAVVRGCGILIEEDKLLQEVRLPSARNS